MLLLPQKEREYLRLTGGATIKPIKDLTLDIDVAYSSVENRYKKYGTPSLTSGYEIFTARPSVEALRDSYGSYLSAATYDYVYRKPDARRIWIIISWQLMPNAGEIMILRRWQVPALKRANMNITGHNAKVCSTLQNRN